MKKDQAMDRLLERAALARQHGSSEPCLDAEMLAGWSDGSLTPAERAAAESHAADCDRCLAMLAAMARTAPPPPPQKSVSWLSIRWLVPLTTAAAAITVWVLVNEPQDTGRFDAAPTATATDTIAPADTIPTPEPDRSSLSRADAPDRRNAKPSRSETKAEVESRTLGDSMSAPSKQTAAGPENRPPASPPSSAPARATAPVLPQSEAVQKRVQPSQRSAIQAPRMIASPDPAILWRVLGASVERSTDGGQTWHTQNPGVTAELMAGSSPARTICWLVGRGGVVLLTADGDTWSRVSFPDTSVDLIAVTALDAATATVTTADGRVFQTSDGGRTWKLQENPAIPF